MKREPSSPTTHRVTNLPLIGSLQLASSSVNLPRGYNVEFTESLRCERCALSRNFNPPIMSEGTLGDLQSEGTEDNVGKRGEKVNCNGEVLRTSDPLKDCSRSENTEQLDTTGGAGDEQTASYSKDPTTHSNHNSESSSSEDEMEGQGDFAANWYVPLPQDPGESDDEEGGEGEGSEQWSEAAIRGQPLLRKQDGEEEGEGQGASSQQVEEVKAASQMEDSES